MDHDITLGKLIDTDERRRDAIHIAVAPVTADHYLEPGEHVGFTRAGSTEFVGHCNNAIGIVDPYLTARIEPGQRFWLLLYPKTITGLRHAWSHPAFAAVAALVREDKR
jgi:hypothetical protein